MKSTAIFLSILGSVLAAPAVVWKNGERGSEGPVRTSTTLRAGDLLADVMSVKPDSTSLASVVFVLGRGQDGTESLSALASAGALPNIEKKYMNADAIHHHVSGVESPSSLHKNAASAGPEQSVLLVGLGELMSRLTSYGGTTWFEVSHNGLVSKSNKHSHKRAQDVSDATVLIVAVDPHSEMSLLDNAVVSAIEHEAVFSVVLTAVRSHDEVKQERLLEHNRQLSLMKNTRRKNHGRRLEDQQEEGVNKNQNGGDDMTGVYYVSITPNILAGILFILMFTFTTYIGVTCMGMIAGQDVYVNKMPPVGREA